MSYNPGAGGGGSVSTVSVVTGNGFEGVVANATTTPSITLKTTISGLIKGSSGALVAAAAGVDYQSVLESGVNIKTVNGSSLLGSGDLTVSGGGTGNSYMPGGW